MNASTLPLVVVSEHLSDRAMEYLRQRARVIQCKPDEAANHITEADGLVVRTYTLVNEDLLSQAKRLKVVGRAGVAIDNIDVPACRARGIEVVHTPAANTLAVVDYTIGVIVLMNRRYWPMSGPVLAEGFHAARKQMFGRFLSGLTLGIVGVGRIGSRVGRAAVGLGMKVLANDILDIKLDYPAEFVEKSELYSRSDIVTIHTPVTNLTKKFINAKALAQFKTGAQFINAARGQCVDYYALADAIKAGKIAAATIDCHDPEPPPQDYPMFGLGESVTLTPHVAARVPEAMERMCDVVFDIMAVINGEKPQYPASDDAGGE
jgi:D-3-phosphoglycerate dehydrogenase